MSTIKSCVLLLFMWCSLPLLAETRHALVIGNDSYPGNALTNARNDATGVYDALKAAGYLSTLILDADKATLSRKVDDFVESLHPGDTALLYYAGHGMQVEGENFLIPVDFKLASSESAKEEAYSLSAVLERFTSHGAATQVVILDACRDNPFLGSRSMRGGWAGLGTSAGAFLAFGTSPGSTASDDPKEGHGLFTKSLLTYLTSSDQDIEELFRKVREDVIRNSAGKQVPWVSSSLIGSFHIRPELDAKQPLMNVPVQDSQAPRENARSFGTLSDDQASVPPGEVGTAYQPQLLEGEIDKINLASIAIRGAKWDTAASILKDVLSADPRCTLALRLLGLTFHAAGRDVDALSAFSQAVQINPRDARAVAYKCAEEGIAGLANAESDCSSAVRTQPSADGYLLLAGAQHASGADDRAYKTATAAISMGGSDLAYAMRGLVSTQRNRADQSERDFARASQMAIEDGRH